MPPLVVRLTAMAAYFAVLGAISSAEAGLSKADLAQIDAAPLPNAVLPLDLPLQGERGDVKPVQQWLGNSPSVWILADFTCETLCGPVISIVSDALVQTGLIPGADFRLIVVGLDPKDTAIDAAEMKNAQVGTDGYLPANAFFLRGDTKDIAKLTGAFGFRSVYDSEHDQFAHPAAAFVVTPGGRIARVLSGLALDPADLRLALVDASQGKIGSWADHIRLLCYGFDPESGVYTAAVGRIMASAGALTIIALALFILILFRREPAMRKD
jgi:protein SCO1/2